MQSVLSLDVIATRANAAGFTVAEITRAAGLSPSTTWRLRKGSTRPLHDTLVKLTLALEAKEAERVEAITKARGASA
jgi:transcriptional regulator with XRE-family HTH domain